MKLYPLEMWLKEDRHIVTCPACREPHSLRAFNGMPVALQTQFCELSHLGASGKDSRLDVTTLAETGIPHLHRTCTRCGFQWIEKVAFEGREPAGAEEVKETKESLPNTVSVDVTHEAYYPGAEKIICPDCGSYGWRQKDSLKDYIKCWSCQQTNHLLRWRMKK